MRNVFIFKKYVEELYNLRLKFPKTDPMNYTAKILLNSLYGRFGMDDKFTCTDILDKIDSEKFIDLAPENIIDILELGTDHYLIESQSQSELLNTYLDNGSETHNVNIAVASAITAYARIHMSQFKNNKEYKLFYKDTDSLYINKPLDEKYISNSELGKLKLESINNKAIFF